MFSGRRRATLFLRPRARRFLRRRSFARRTRRGVGQPEQSDHEIVGRFGVRQHLPVGVADGRRHILLGRGLSAHPRRAFGPPQGLQHLGCLGRSVIQNEARPCCRAGWRLHETRALPRMGLRRMRLKRHRPAGTKSQEFGIGTSQCCLWLGKHERSRACAVAETQSARAGVPAGAIPTVDFLLHDFGRVVKKTRVKTHV